MYRLNQLPALLPPEVEILSLEDCFEHLNDVLELRPGGFDVFGGDRIEALALLGYLHVHEFLAGWWDKADVAYEFLPFRWLAAELFEAIGLSQEKGFRRAHPEGVALAAHCICSSAFGVEPPNLLFRPCTLVMALAHGSRHDHLVTERHVELFLRLGTCFDERFIIENLHLSSDVTAYGDMHPLFGLLSSLYLHDRLVPARLFRDYDVFYPTGQYHESTGREYREESHGFFELYVPDTSSAQLALCFVDKWPRGLFEALYLAFELKASEYGARMSRSCTFAFIGEGGQLSEGLGVPHDAWNLAHTWRWAPERGTGEVARSLSVNALMLAGPTLLPEHGQYGAAHSMAPYSMRSKPNPSYPIVYFTRDSKTSFSKAYSAGPPGSRVVRLEQDLVVPTYLGCHDDSGRLAVSNDEFNALWSGDKNWEIIMGKHCDPDLKDFTTGDEEDSEGQASLDYFLLSPERKEAVKKSAQVHYFLRGVRSVENLWHAGMIGERKKQSWQLAASCLRTTAAEVFPQLFERALVLERAYETLGNSTMEAIQDWLPLLPRYSWALSSRPWAGQRWRTAARGLSDEVVNDLDFQRWHYKMVFEAIFHSPLDYCEKGNYVDGRQVEHNRNAGTLFEGEDDPGMSRKARVKREKEYRHVLANGSGLPKRYDHLIRLLVPRHEGKPRKGEGLRIRVGGTGISGFLVDGFDGIKRAMNEAASEAASASSRLTKVWDTASATADFLDKMDRYSESVGRMNAMILPAGVSRTKTSSPNSMLVSPSIYAYLTSELCKPDK